MDALLSIVILSYVQQLTDLLHFIKEKTLFACAPSPRGDVSKQGTIWNLDVIYSLSEKRRSARPNGIYLKNNAKREVTLTFPPGLLCVHNKSVLHARDVGFVLS